MRLFRKTSREEAPRLVEVETASGPVPVRLRRSARARRMNLTVSGTKRMATLTLPTRIGTGEGLAFLDRHADWLAERVAAIEAAVPFVEGAVFPLRGAPVRIVRTEGRAGAAIRTEDGTAGTALVVPSSPARLDARVAAYLKGEARRDVEAAVALHARRLGLKHGPVRIGDPKSRWGSCSSTRALSFSWRLILAPADVLDYVAAHEVCHLAEMNHGPRFWACVAETCPGFETPRRWLRRHGAALHRYGA